MDNVFEELTVGTDQSIGVDFDYLFAEFLDILVSFAETVLY